MHCFSYKFEFIVKNYLHIRGLDLRGEPIDGVDVKIVCFVLDVLDHKEYNKKFNYR